MDYIEIISETLTPEECKVIEEEMNAFLESMPHVIEALKSRHHDAVFRYLAGLPPLPQ